MRYENFKRFVGRNREPFFEIAKNYINENTVVLDIGAGDGLFAKVLNKYKKLFLIEGREQSFLKLKEEWENVVKATVPPIPFGDNVFDVIHCSHLIEHLQPNDLYLFFKECDRCLKSEGKLIISSPCLYDDFYNDLTHIKPYNPGVIMSYFIREIEGNYSKDAVSLNYKLIEIIYRYKIIEDEYVWTNTKSKIFDAITFYSLRLLRFLGFRKFVRSGYTIVIEKK